MIIDRSLLYSAKKGTYEAPTKTKNFRALRLSPQSLDMLQKWKAECERMKKENKDRWIDTPYIFVRDNGEPIHPDSITYWLNKFSDEHDIPHLHPHAFRHTAASTLIANGVDLVTTAARRAGKEASALNGLVRPSCLIIDEVGHCEFDKENTRLFFDLIDRRYNKEGNFNIVFTSNKSPSQWRRNFNEDDALLCSLDRIFDDATVFNIKGESFRGKHLETIALQTGRVKAP